MGTTRRSLITGLTTLGAVGFTAFAVGAAPTSDPAADHAAADSLRKLISGNPAARTLNDKAVGVLIFPRIVKIGFLFGGAYGEGVLRQGDKTVGYYNSAAASYGLQAGVQWFGYALFFMNQGALK
jgi:lipid-binding SYLF domain-containing protein